MSHIHPDFLADGGRMGTLMRAFDWQSTPLGEPGSWPQPLRTLVAVMLGSNQPMFVAWGPERTMLYNDAYAQILGQRHPCALGRPFYEVWYDVRAEVGPILERAYAGQPTHMDDIALVLHRHGYAEETHFGFSYTPVRDETGAVAGMFCACVETTEKVMADRRQRILLDLEDRIRDLTDPTEIAAAVAEMLGEELEVAQVGYSEADPSGEWIAIARDWGDGRIPSVVGRHRLADFGEELVAELRAGRAIAVSDVRATQAAAAAAAFEALSIRAVLAVPLVKKGRLTATLFLHHCAPRVWTEDELTLVRDVAERTWATVQRGRAEAALRESEARFRHMADRSPLIVWVSEPDGSCSYLGQTWESFTGHPCEAGLGFGWVDHIHPDDREAGLRKFQDARAGRDDLQLEFRLRRHDGEWRWVICAAAPRLAEDGTFLGHVGSTLDITERKQAEQALHQAKEMAEQADLAKSKFLAAASHDLRQPMQSLFLFVELLRPTVANRGKEALRHLVGGLDVMRELLDSLLDVSRLDARVVQPEIEDFPLRPLFDQLGGAYGGIAAEKGLVLRVSGCTDQVRSDRTLLGRMLRNLLENAIRYTEAGEIHVACVAVAGDRLRIEVRDTGIGIPAEHLGQIWEEFHQVGNEERDRTRGLGLGLAIVQKLSRLLDHPVTVDSAPGRGSVFAIEVPVVAG